MSTVTIDDSKQRQHRRMHKSHRGLKKKATVGQVLRMVKHMQPKIEKKYFDTQINISVVSAATITPLELITQGSDVIQRIGNTITVTSVQFKGDVLTGDATNFIRHILFIDKDSNGAAPALVDVLDTSVITQPIWSPYNNDNKFRFRIIYDNVYNVNTVNQPFVMDKQFIKTGKKGLQSTFAASGGVQANLLSNQIYSILVSDSALGPHPGGYFGYRVRYQDA